MFKSLLFFVLLGSTLLSAQPSYLPHWTVESNTSIHWDLANTQNLPHTDNIEMAGKRVAGIIHYSIDTNKVLSIEREIFFPQLHPFIKESDPAWYVYRAYFKETFDDEILPTIYVNNKAITLGQLKSVTIDGQLTFEHHASKSGIVVQRSFYPSMSDRLFEEQWKLSNTTDSTININIASHQVSKTAYGEKGRFVMGVQTKAPQQVQLEPNQSINFPITIEAKLNQEQIFTGDWTATETGRRHFLKEITGSLNLETPNQTLNTLFEFSKIRAAESIFESELGLIHSPGGGRYYVGIWANDQAEYISPFFPFLGYKTGNETAINTFRAFAKEINPAFDNIRYAFEMEGLVPPFDLDRGDAAMIAYGAAQFALANGNALDAKEIWPLIKWCLEYCRRQLNTEGVVQSESDEMEGRIETGNANLSTSALYYGALLHAADVAKALEFSSEITRQYRNQAKSLRQSIERYFGATVEGLDTYKYYKEHQHLRHWICLPLVVGIHDRKDATITALFDRLWTSNGVHVEKNSTNEAISKIFWDRGTLYALRGTFLAGATDRSLEKLQTFTKQRLLGKRVPYVVEAYPEGNMAHLSAESALYCRVFIEGLFGIRVTGLNSFSFRPKLPTAWNKMALRNIKAFGKNFDIEVYRQKDLHQIKIFDNSSNRELLKVMSDLEEEIHFEFSD